MAQQTSKEGSHGCMASDMVQMKIKEAVSTMIGAFFRLVL